MKFIQLSLLSFPAIVAAQGIYNPNFGRQATTVVRPATTTTTPAGAPPPPTSTTTPQQLPPPTSSPSSSLATSNGTIVANATTTTISYSFSLEATNPTAIPLSAIVSGASSQPTQPLDSTYAPGSVPTFLPGAPPLPNAALLNPANYPALDMSPPTNSPEVQQWIQEVANSGITIPNISPTVPGGCSANLQAVADDANRCWWTCGGCTRSDDITTCPDKMTWGLTYDDGPAFHTPDLLSFLDSKQLKSTFFVVGSRAISFPVMLQSEYMSQNQIAVHTWSHPPLTTLSNEAIIAELGWSKKVIRDVLGVTPNVMRPPYGDIDDRVRAISLAMGLTPVIWTRLSPLATFDTGDFNIAGGSVSVGQVLQNWEQIIGNATTMSTGFIVLEHDLFQQSVDVATGYILPDALAHSFNIKPVISCLHMPLTNAYIETNDNTTNPPKASFAPVTTQPGGSTSSSSGDVGALNLNLVGLLTSAAGVVAGASLLFL
jgi:peptidoglycan/xylan/chitin deacetylase (PgdA/CDA1 family)